jgi:hypothetical protein
MLKIKMMIRAVVTLWGIVVSLTCTVVVFWTSVCRVRVVECGKRGSDKYYVLFRRDGFCKASCSKNNIYP